MSNFSFAGGLVNTVFLKEKIPYSDIICKEKKS
jgi:hypothetical protein